MHSSVKIHAFLFLISSLNFITGVSSIEPPEPFLYQCKIHERKSINEVNHLVPLLDVDLGKDAFLRWQQVGKLYKSEILDLIKTVKIEAAAILGAATIKWIEKQCKSLDDRLPADFSNELKGLAEATEIPLGDIVLYNIFYEIFSVCTSIVAENIEGRLFHARNMDFGLFLGWNKQSHDWLIAEKLRHLIINVQFSRNGTKLYKAASFAGYVGVYTGMKPNAFAVTINERFTLDGGYVGLVEWLLGVNNASWVSWMVRGLFDEATDFDSAVKLLSTTPVIAPFYAIVSGTKSSEGQIIVRSRNSTLGIVELQPNKKLEADGWFILQTNSDPWRNPFFLDDRTTPGRRCVQHLGRQNVSMSTLLQVLNSTPVLNKLTVFSTLISTQQDTLQTYVQKCSDPCWPW